jgi:hypothetical protein
LNERSARLRVRQPSVRLDLVDSVPAESLDERTDVLEALPAIGADGPANVVAGHGLLRPDAVFELEADASRDPERRVCRKGIEETIEVVGLDRHIGIDLQHDIRRTIERLDAGLEREDIAARAAAFVQAPAAGLSTRGRNDLDPRVLGGQLHGELEGPVLRAVVDDHPGIGRRRLRLERAGEAFDVAQLVARRCDDRVARGTQRSGHRASTAGRMATRSDLSCPTRAAAPPREMSMWVIAPSATPVRVRKASPRDWCFRA